MTSSKSASSQRPPSQLGSGGLAKAIGLSTKSRPMRTTTNDQRIFIGLSANGTGARKRSIGYPLCAGSVDKRLVWSSTNGAGVKVSAHPNLLMLPGHSKIRLAAQSLPPLSRELGVVAGGHRVFRCTGLELTRAACDLTPLDQQTPQTLLQWELVSITEKQRRGLDDHEHRDDDSPRGEPRANFPSQVKTDASYSA